MRRKREKSRSGLTLIEMMVALAAVCIVLLAAAIMMVFGQRSLNRGWQQANLQRDAAYAMLKIKESIRGGTGAILDEDGRGVKVFHTGGWMSFWFVPGTNRLLYQLQGEEAKILLDGTVSNATFEVDTVTHKTVTVGLELEKSGCETRILSTTLMRNYGT